MAAFLIWGDIWADIWALIWAPGTDAALMGSIQLQIARELNGAVQFLDPAFADPSTPTELNASIRIVSDRAQGGAVTFVPAAMRAYYIANLGT